MDLFDFEHPEGTGKLGFRLQKLEVYNWGTFNEKVWTLNLNGDTSLLTGDVGSGKSTLVDALITLLVPPRKVTYNKAADASAKERSLASYVRGYFAQKRTSDGGGQPEALRDMNHYSVISAVFHDSNLGETVSVAQVFWFKTEQRWPMRFYVVADKTLMITEHFSNFGDDIKQLKKRLERDYYIRTYDDYPAYSRDFRRKFGIKQEQALDLFQQTISMKKVDELTGFVRQNMLEVPDAEDDVKNLLGHFRDLDAAHETVVKARKQQSLLRPIVQLGDLYQTLGSEKINLNAMQSALKAWFAQSANEILNDELQLFRKEHAAAELKRQEEAKVLADTERQLKNVERDIAQNGGQRLEKLQMEIANDQQKLEIRRNALQSYGKLADVLALPLPEDKVVFEENRVKLADCRAQEIALAESLANELSDYEINRNDTEKEKKKTEEELESLRSRKSSIPREYIELRNALCKSLDLAESEMPFVGELLEVKEDESAWEGAIERLLRGFGISLLVPDVHYAEVVDWIEKTPIHLKFVYYRVKAEVEQIDHDVEEDVVCSKLNIRQDSPFYAWLCHQLQQRFRHQCAESMAQFRKADYAITRAGQVKVGGKRHEKDDRHRIDDRRQYVLGFSNQKKINALEQEVVHIKAEVKRWNKLIKETKDKQAVNQKHISIVDQLLDNFEDFSLLYVKEIEMSISEKMQELAELEKANDALKQLKVKLGQLQSLVEEQKQTLESTNKAIYRAQILMDQKEKQVRDYDMIIVGLDEQVKDFAYPLLRENQTIALANEKFTLDKLQLLENKYAEWLRQQSGENDEKLTQAANTLIGKMTSYNALYPLEMRAIDAHPTALNEYKSLLNQLELDGLPKFEETFKSLLRENTINQIALFQGKLNLACDLIEERIDMINHSLNSIDYNEGRYIQIEYMPAIEPEIKDFRMKLRACTDNTLTGIDDDQYNEAKFLQVKEIVERFRGRPDYTDIDEKWRRKVIDVRNWYAFAASERWRETDEEYEHYTDSGGKSGGQKEKLAYTILAASLVYNFGLESKDERIQSFRFVVIDEAFLKSSDDSARFGLELFKKLELQLLVVTPLLKIATIEPFVTHVGFVYQNDELHCSSLRNLTVKELKEERRLYEEN